MNSIEKIASSFPDTKPSFSVLPAQLLMLWGSSQEPWGAKDIDSKYFDEALLKERSLIETVFEQLKNLSKIEHTRHHSMSDFIVHLLEGIVAYF